MSQPDDALTHAVIGAAIEVHRVLGPGLLENIYEECLCHELSLRRISFQKQVAVPVAYKDLRTASPLRLDLIVAGALIIEIKSIDHIEEIHRRQLVSYLRLSKCSVGLLLNFNVAILRAGVRRVTIRTVDEAGRDGGEEQVTKPGEVTEAGRRV